MSGAGPFALAAGALVALGLYGFITGGHPVRRLLAVNVFGNGVFMGFILIAYRLPGGVDPIPHAMVITGLVIAVSATAFGLALVRRQALDRDDGARTGDRDAP